VSSTLHINVQRVIVTIATMSAVERAEAKVCFLREAQAVAERLRVNEEEHTTLLAQRAEKARALRQAGATIEELQDVLGVSRSRVHQILRGSRS
jgi:AraC-like DNA-binding protein